MFQPASDDEITLPSPIQEADETEDDPEDGFGGTSNRIEEVVLEEEAEGDRAQVLKLSPKKNNFAPMAPPQQLRPVTAAVARASAPTRPLRSGTSLGSSRSGEGEKVTATSNVSMEMMRVALAGWNEAEQGPTDSPLDEDLESPGDIKSFRSTYPDPQEQKFLLSGRVNQVVVVLNVGFGLVYLCWRVFRSMNPTRDWHDWAPVGTYFVDPEDPERAWSVKEEFKYNWFCWLLFLAEIMLMISIWLGHASRCFPSKR